MKNRRIVCGAIALLTVFGLTACGATDGARNESSTMTTASTVYYDTVEEFYDAEEEFGTAYDYSGGAADEKVSIESESGGTNDLSERKIIKTAEISYETKTYDDFFASLNSYIRKYGAYIESEESYGGGVYDIRSTRSTRLTVRVPLDGYESFMDEVCLLGSVTYRSESSNDVTMSYVDTESRISALEAEYDALLKILESADELDDVIALQSRISEVTYELETYKAKLRKYDDLISYCTVNIDVREVEKVTPNVREMTFGEKLISGLGDTFENIADDATDFALWFVVSLPYFVIWGAIIVLAVLALRPLLRRYRRRREERAARKVEENEGGDKTDN